MSRLAMHFCGTDPPGVAFVYASDRTAERPMSHLEGFTGILQVDGFAGYRKRKRCAAPTFRMKS